MKCTEQNMKILQLFILFVDGAVFQRNLSLNMVTISKKFSIF